MTNSTSGMSRPRAATSVATSRGTAPDLKVSTALLRCCWLMSPWMAATCVKISPLIIMQRQPQLPMFMDFMPQ